MRRSLLLDIYRLTGLCLYPLARLLAPISPAFPGRSAYLFPERLGLYPRLSADRGPTVWLHAAGWRLSFGACGSQGDDDSDDAIDGDCEPGQDQARSRQPPAAPDQRHDQDECCEGAEERPAGRRQRTAGAAGDNEGGPEGRSGGDPQEVGVDQVVAHDGLKAGTDD